MSLPTQDTLFGERLRPLSKGVDFAAGVTGNKRRVIIANINTSDSITIVGSINNMQLPVFLDTRIGSQVILITQAALERIVEDSRTMARAECLMQCCSPSVEIDNYYKYTV